LDAFVIHLQADVFCEACHKLFDVPYRPDMLDRLANAPK